MADDTTKLVISLDLILRNLDRTLKGLSQVEKQLQRVTTIKVGGTANFDRATVAAQRLQIQQQKLAIQAQELANREERARQTTERLAAARERLGQASQRQVLTEQRAAQQVAKINADTARQAERQQAIRERAARTLANVQVREARRTADELAQSLGKTGQRLEAIRSQLNTLGAAALRVGGGLRSFGATAAVTLTAPLVALAAAATRNAIEFDSLQRGLTVMAGSAEEAANQLERLKEIAKAPGIGFQEAIQGSIRLQAVGFSAQQAEEALKQFANAVALTGGGRSELERITVQLGQLAAKGKIVAQDLKPIIEAGPAVGQALLKAFGTVNSEDIQALGLTTEEFFDKLIAALTELPRAAAGARNAFENFQDSVFRASLALGNALIPALQKLADAALPIIESIADAFKSLPEPVQLTIVAIGAFAAALGPVLFLLGGIISGIGALATALGAILPILGTIGLPALLLVLGGLVATVGELATIVTAVAIAWKTNFLSIREMVGSAAAAVKRAFGEIKNIFDEASRRILPTLQSIITRVVGITTRLWERYGQDIVRIVGGAFRFILGVTETFLRAFSDFVDLVLKLVDGDWAGAWNAFARIVINSVKSVGQSLVQLAQIVNIGMALLVKAVVDAAVRLVKAGQEIATRFITALADEIVHGAPNISGAIANMLALAVEQVNVTSIAAVLMARFIAALQRAAAVAAPPDTSGPQVGADIGLGGGITRRRAAGFGAARAKGGGGGGGDAALRQLQQQEDALREAQDRLEEQRRQSRIASIKAGIQQQFELTKDGLERELVVLDQNFEDRKTAVRSFFAERQRLQEEEINNEIANELALSRTLKDELESRQETIRAEFERTKAQIQADPKLTGRARELALQTAEIEKQTKLAQALTDFETSQADLATRIAILKKQLGDITRNNTRDEDELTKAIQRQQDEIKADLFESQGRTLDAAAIRLKAQFKETLRDLRVDVQTLPKELQDALGSVDLSTLQANLEQLPEPIRQMVELFDIAIQKADILEKQQLVDTFSNQLRNDEERVQQKVLDGVISERQGRQEILEIQKRYKGVLLDILEGELARAKAIKDQDQITRIEAQIAAVEQLGRALDDVGIQINRDLFQTLQSGFEDVFNSLLDGTERVKDAFINLGRNILAVFNRQLSEQITEALFGSLLKPGATNTQNTLGGFFSRLFGFGQNATGGSAGKAGGTVIGEAAGKATEGATAAAALTTGATTAGAAMAAGGTTAGTAMATGSVAFTTAITTAAAGFATAVISAGAAFAAAVAAGSAAQAVGSAGSSIAGAFAATGMFPATPGGLVRIVEGGFDEAVLTTDPAHAAQQVRILQQFLSRTKGLYGRIQGFADGGIISAREAEMNMLASLGPRRSVIPAHAPVPQLAAAGSQGSNVRILNLIDRRHLVGGHLRSAEGTQDVMNLISANSDEIGRRLRIK